MDDERLTPQERAVIEAAKGYCKGDHNGPLYTAVNALLAAERPPETECLMTRLHGDLTNPDGWCAAYTLDTAPTTLPRIIDEVWRVRIVPIERAR